jgi:ABC-type uncharacterized transport system substrate-binding protein
MNQTPAKVESATVQQELNRWRWIIEPKTVALLLFTVLFGSLLLHPGTAKAQASAQKTYKILVIHSYHSPWRWTDWQLDGFKEGLGPVAAEYRVFQMDTKQVSNKDSVEKKAADARKLIDSWKPDLVYSTDDDVQEYIARHYVNSNIPFVFSGVNKHPSTYGFVGSKNVTGVLEEEHFVETLNLVRAIVPNVKRIAVVFDEAAMWAPVRDRVSTRITQVPGAEIATIDVIRTWDEFKTKMLDYPKQGIDAVGLVGIFNFKDAQGKNVPYQEVLKWTAENSKLPDFGFWIDRVHYGTLAAATVSEREQGLAAGKIARGILVDGKPASDFAMKPTVKGTPVISLARAKKLGINVKSGVLLSSEVIEKFEWEKQ